MRKNQMATEPCISLAPGHGPNPAAGYPVRGENWEPADVKVAFLYKVGLVVFVHRGEAWHHYFAHDLFAIRTLLQPARGMAPGEFGALFNPWEAAIAIPAGSRPDRRLRVFSLSKSPLGECLFERDDALGLEFATLTAGLQIGQRKSGLAS